MEYLDPYLIILLASIVMTGFNIAITENAIIRHFYESDEPYPARKILALLFCGVFYYLYDLIKKYREK